MESLCRHHILLIFFLSSVILYKTGNATVKEELPDVEDEPQAFHSIIEELEEYNSTDDRQNKLINYESTTDSISTQHPSTIPDTTLPSGSTPAEENSTSNATSGTTVIIGSSTDSSIINRTTITTTEDYSSSSSTADAGTTIVYPTPFPPEPTTIENNSTSETPEIPEPGKHKAATWAIVLISVLITFCVLITMLHFFRKYMLRKRKLDRRRLLASQEGFFAGNESDTGMGTL